LYVGLRANEVRPYRRYGKGVEEKRWEAEEGVPYGDEAIM